jgi:crossover junction endodeoxyribonuclease RuvC
MKVLGVDPGIHGGLAIVDIIDGPAPQLIDASDIPVTGVKAKERADVLAIRAWIETHQPDHAVIERGQAMPRQGASSGYKYGRSIGAIEATIALCNIPLTIVEPTAWKKFHGLTRRPVRARRKSKKQVGSAPSNYSPQRIICSLGGWIMEERKPPSSH